MSDRIDELVDTPEQALRYLDTVMCSDNEDLRRGAYNRVSIHIKQLATIAREAEADAAEWIDRCYQSEERALKAEAMCEWLAERLEESDDTVLAADTWLVAAREAVTHER